MMMPGKVTFAFGRPEAGSPGAWARSVRGDFQKLQEKVIAKI
jgi:hypothetical protein